MSSQKSQRRLHSHCEESHKSFLHSPQLFPQCGSGDPSLIMCFFRQRLGWNTMSTGNLSILDFPVLFQCMVELSAHFPLQRLMSACDWVSSSQPILQVLLGQVLKSSWFFLVGCGSAPLLGVSHCPGFFVDKSPPSVSSLLIFSLLVQCMDFYLYFLPLTQSQRCHFSIELEDAMCLAGALGKLEPVHALSQQEEDRLCLTSLFFVVVSSFTLIYLFTFTCLCI